MNGRDKSTQYSVQTWHLRSLRRALGLSNDGADCGVLGKGALCLRCTAVDDPIDGESSPVRE